MTDDKMFEQKLKEMFTDVEVPSSLEPENIMKALKEPPARKTITIRRISAMAAGLVFVVCATVAVAYSMDNMFMAKSAAPSEETASLAGIMNSADEDGVLTFSGEFDEAESVVNDIAAEARSGAQEDCQEEEDEEDKDKKDDEEDEEESKQG